jgi:hypothetical protein
MNKNLFICHAPAQLIGCVEPVMMNSGSLWFAIFQILI